jgi:hypothetical protein
MANNKYAINKGVAVNAAYKRTVEADSYKLAEGYFSFYDGVGNNAKKVFTIAATQVHIVERVED